jgi:hypothetical protein
VVYSKILCLYVDRRWHNPSTSELFQSNVKVVTLLSTVGSHFRTPTSPYWPCIPHVCSPPSQMMHFFNTNIIARELKSGCQPHNTRGFKIPYSQMIKISKICAPFQLWTSVYIIFQNLDSTSWYFLTPCYQQYQHGSS